MEYISRKLEAPLKTCLDRGKSVLLLGPRQTGKSTLLARIPNVLAVSFLRPQVRLRYEKDPDLLAGEVEQLPQGKPPLVLLDEVQKVPAIMDVVQDLIDRGVARFILTGSSARKLRRGSEVNLLPGRLVPMRLDPFTQGERASSSLRDLLLYGSLPGIERVSQAEDKEVELDAYVTMYLEEEVRAESLVRNLANFSRFLELAASESGRIVNFRGLSQDVGVSHTTIAAYYQILEDCLIAERVEPLTESRTRKKLSKSQRYLLFDMGIRRRAAREGTDPPRDQWGHLFEHWVGLELIRLCRLRGPAHRVRYWKDLDGPEVDWVVQQDRRLTPIEVKWSESPNLGDARHLRTFLSEHPSADRGFIICRAPRPLRLNEQITALPWRMVESVF